MEENTNMAEQTQAENMGNETEVQGAAGEGREGKLFTQEEVNNLIQSRLSRLKGQISKEAKTEYEQKLAELQAKEVKLMVKERLSDRGMPRELADIITCTDEKDLDNKLDALQKIYGEKPEEKKRSEGFRQVGAYYTPHNGTLVTHDPVRGAMGLKG